MKKTTFIFALFFSLLSFGQAAIVSTNSYPTNYFANPMNIPLILSGTFAELRPNHFHSGIDIKTNQREGIDVLASAEGYVSRIKITHWGFGRALYIDHPNGYTTVYGHLKKFSDKIENYIKKEQYKIESFEVEVFPTANELPVTKQELIAYSGSSGGFMAPHLHFEIRDTKSERTINPMHFGLNFSDTTKPKINTLVGYSLDSISHINTVNEPILLHLTKQANGDLLANKITAFGAIGFGINAYDQLNAAPNQNGLYSLKVLVNGQKVHEFEASSFDFKETRFINVLIDFERFKTKGQRIQKCFNVPSTNLSLTKNALNNGILTIKDGMNYTVEIIASDFKGNQQKLTIPITGKKDAITSAQKAIAKTPYLINYKNDTEFTNKYAKVSFPKNTFYNDFYLDFEVTDAYVKVHNILEPINGYYTLTFDVSKYDTETKNQLYIASVSSSGKTSYETTYKKVASFYTLTKNLGKFTLLTDNKKPTITLVNFKDQQWISNHTELKVKISDYGSGIKSYRAEIDGKWILMEYDVTTSVLTYNLADANYMEANHDFKITVIDNVGNLTTLDATFFRKQL